MDGLIGEVVQTRKDPRVPAHLMVKLKVNDRAVSVRSTDLSMAGLCLQAELPELQEFVRLSIPLPDDSHVTTDARVAWRDDERIALEFKELDWEDMFALARFLHPRLP
jgi:hypothetical protein